MELDAELVKTALLIIWLSIILIGASGNALVGYVLLRHGKHSTTNTYVTNLAATDLLFLLVAVPLTAIHYFQLEWKLGLFACKFHVYLIYVTLMATCLTLTAMTLDRYYIIVHPLDAHVRSSPRSARIISVAIWLVSFPGCAVFFSNNGLRDRVYNESGGTAVNYTVCESVSSRHWQAATSVSIVLLTYVVPLVIIVFSYSGILNRLYKQQKNNAAAHRLAQSGQHWRKQQLMRRRVSRMVATVVLLFALLWLPIHVYQLWSLFDRHFVRNQYTYLFKCLAHTLSYLNSAVNPFVYGCLSDGFRQAARHCFSTCICSQQHPATTATTRDNATFVPHTAEVPEEAVPLEEIIHKSPSNGSTSYVPSPLIPRPEVTSFGGTDDGSTMDHVIGEQDEGEPNKE